MEFPFGHHRHHNKREEEEEEQYPPPEYRPNRPPDYPFQQGEGAYTEPSVYHQRPHHHRPGLEEEEQQQGGYRDNRYERPYQPPPSAYGNYSDFQNYPRPPPPSDHHPVYPTVQHVSHEVGFDADPSGFGREESHHHRNPMSSIQHHHHQKASEGSGGVVNRPTVRVFCKAENGFSLTVRDGTVVLARSDVNDEFQHWIKDEKYSIRVKDEEGFPSFALVNKATGQAIKHSIGATHPVQLCPYDSDVLDESVLWTESRDIGDGYRAVRMVNNIRLNLDALHGDKNHGGVHDGTTIVLWEWKKGDNQRWKIVPYCFKYEPLAIYPLSPSFVSHSTAWIGLITEMGYMVGAYQNNYYKMYGVPLSSKFYF